MKKILLLLSMFISFCFVPNFITLAETPLQVRVIYSYINVYSTNDISSSQTIASFNYDHVFNVVSQSTGSDGFEYYLVELENVQDYTEGYVFKSQVLDASITSPQKQLDANASIASACDTYLLSGSNYIKSSTTLPAGTQIKILSGYNTNNEYTQIQYANENNKIITAYIKTSAIHVGGVSSTLIGAVIIIITTVSLVLIIFGIGKKKKIKKKI